MTKTIEPITFDDALKKTSNKRRHLLLGNGFSIAASKSFKYEFLADEARKRNAEVGELFDAFGTHDFEVVMRKLKDERDRAGLVQDRRKMSELDRLTNAVREALLDTIFDVHPIHRDSIEDKCFEGARDFLKHFIGRDKHARPGGIAFTTNYDTLLIWLVAKYQTIRATKGDLRFHDAFGHGVWLEDQMHQTRMSMVYLHGALPLFNRGGRVHRIIYNNEGPQRTLRDQIRERLRDNERPLVVTEGTYEEKKARIRDDPYLSAACEKFHRSCCEAKTVLFTFGHSLDVRDHHLCEAIGGGKVDEVFIGTYGSPDAHKATLDGIAARIRAERAPRADRYPLRLYAYDTSQLRVWEPPLEEV